MLRRNIIVAIALLSAVCARADEYDRLLEKYADGDPSVAVSVLKDYQKKHPETGHVYMALGRLSEQLAEGLHPITDYATLSQYLFDAQLFYGNCMHFATDDEVRSHNAYYRRSMATDQRVTMQSMTQFLTEKRRSTIERKAAVDALYRAFYGMVDSYNGCVEAFFRFCQKYPNRKDALLLADKGDLLLLDTLGAKYGGFTEAQRRFLAQLDSMPIAGYQPQFTVKSIDFYRLDGLNTSDFLRDDISVWNYAEWVQTFKNGQLPEVQRLRNDIDSQTHALARLYGRWTASTDTVRQLPFAAPPRALCNRINLFDYQSPLLPYFDFQVEAVNLAMACHRPENTLCADPEKLVEQAKCVSDLRRRLERLRAAYADFAEKAQNPVSLEKHRAWVRKFFPEGLGERMDGMLRAAEESVHESVGKLHDNVLQTDSVCTAKCSQMPSDITLSAATENLRYCLYDDIAKTLLLAYEADGNVALRCADVDGRELWRTDYPIAGRLVDVVPVGDRFWLFADDGGVAVQWTVTQGGLPVAQRPVPDFGGVRLLRAIKLNAETIALVGDRGGEGVYCELATAF